MPYVRLIPYALFAAVCVMGGVAGSLAIAQTPPAATDPAPVPLLPLNTAAPAPAAATTPAPTASDAEHFARGEIKYGEGWAPIMDVFKDYQAARAELAPFTAKADEVRTRQAEILHQLNDMKSDNQTAERPIRTELAKAKGKEREYTRALEAKPPVRPTPRPVPPQPRQNLASSRNQSSYSGSSSYDYQYDQQMNNWRQQADAINQANQQLQAKYKQEMDTYTRNLNDARKEMPKAQAAIKDSEAKLDQSAKDLLTKQAPTAEKAKTIGDDLAAALRQVDAAMIKVKTIGDALQAAPESMRFKHGIVEWDGVFQLLAELEKIYTDTQAEIARVHEQLKAEAAAAGRPFAMNWRHPQQDRMDALQALLAKARAGQAAK